MTNLLPDGKKAAIELKLSMGMLNVYMLSGRSVFVATWVGYAGFYLCRKNFSVLMPLFGEHLGAARELLANALFIYSAAYALGQVSMGVLADRIGARRVVLGGMLLSSAATLAMGFTSNPGMLYLWLGINGLAQACGWPALVKIVSSWFGKTSRGVTVGLWCTSYVIGAFAATAFATFAATGGSWSWRMGAWAPAALLAMLAFPVWWFARDGPLGASQSGDPPRAPLDAVLRNPAIQTIAAAYFCIKLTRYAFLFWLPTYMVEHLGYSVSEAGYTSSLFELLGFAGVLLAGYASDRWMNGRRFPVGAVMLAGLAVACLAYPALSASGRWGNWIAIAMVGMLTFGPDTLMGGAATQDLAHPTAAATAAGYVNSVGSAGQALSPLVVASVTSVYGWNSLFHVLVFLTALAALALATRWSDGKTEIRATAAVAQS